MAQLVPCPDCELTVQVPPRTAAATARCPACDASLAGLVAIAPEELEPGPEPEICARCQALVDLVDGRCPRCRFLKRAAAQWSICATCGEKNDPDNVHCVECTLRVAPLTECGGCGVELTAPTVRDDEAWCSAACRGLVTIRHQDRVRSASRWTWLVVLACIAGNFAAGAFLGALLTLGSSLALASIALTPLRRASHKPFSGTQALVTIVIVLAGAFGAMAAQDW